MESFSKSLLRGPGSENEPFSVTTFPERLTQSGRPYVLARSNFGDTLEPKSIESTPDEK
jgi:hypothetical protein